MIIKVIIPYFGKFPPYFDFFIESCRCNSEISFLIFTDQISLPNLPDNVIIQTCSFEDIKKLVQNKLALDIKRLKAFSPYKLCDYKPAYGKIFEDYLTDADFWGFCDVDLVFGRIFNVLSIKEFQKSERILTQGHLTFYKNSERMKLMFLKNIKKGINFWDAISFNEPAFFDEIFMPAICRANQVIQYGQNQFADILPQYSRLLVAPACTISNHPDQRFYWQQGRLFQSYVDSKEEVRQEIMYIHLQKRPLLPYYDKKELQGDDRIFFTPQGIFSSFQYDIGTETENKYHVKQYQKKRWKSLTLRKIWVKFKIKQLGR